MPGHSKVGIASDPRQRLSGYLTATPGRDTRYYQTWRVRDRAAALRVEQQTLETARAAGWPVKHEWMQMHPELVARVVDDLITEDELNAL